MSAADASERNPKTASRAGAGGDGVAASLDAPSADQVKRGLSAGNAGRRIGFLLIPTFSMLPFVSAVEPLRLANRLSGRDLYGWRFFSRDGEPVRAGNGMLQIPHGSIDDVPAFPVMIVCGPHDPHLYRDRKVFAWLRSLARHGTEMGALCTGSFVLARAGLMHGRRCTIHWENLLGFTEEFPDIEVSAELYEIDRNRLTCSGGTAAIDMMLNVIAREHGHDLAAQVSEQLIVERIRRPYDPQRMSLRQRLGASHPKLLAAVALMESNVEEPLAPGALAAEVGLSKRQLERLFRHYLHATPAAYYMDVRLKFARRLLEQTSLPVSEVALACGFSSPAHFSLRYRDRFGLSPRQDRRAIPLGADARPDGTTRT